MKRHFGQEGEEEEDGSFTPQPKRPRSWENAMREVVAARSMQQFLSNLEPFFRRVVQEEVQNVFRHYAHSAPRLPAKRIQAAVTRPYQLHFQNKLPGTLFTGSRIEAEGKMHVQIVIMDTELNEIVTSGPLSTTKIEILVLDGDFGGDGQEVWTEEEFSDNIVREREGKRPLLTGELVITLNNGVGYLGDATFTDNSSWIRSRKFRLGAKSFQSRCSEVHEAITEAFLVKDHRGELYKKHHPPVLFDEVWRLEKIGKDGVFHKRLAENGINTVQDFLRFFVLDQDRLRTLLGSGMSNKIWEATVEHARECVLDDKLYSYSSGQGVVLLFDSIFQLVGAIFDRIYHPLDGLTPSQKVLVNKQKELAFKVPSNIVEFNELLVGRPPRPLDMIDSASSQEASLLVPRNPDLPATYQADSAMQLSFQHQPQASFNQLLGDQSQLKDIFTGPGLHPIPCFDSFRTSSFGMRDLMDAQFGDIRTSGIVGSVMTDEHLVGFNSVANMPSSSPPLMAWDHENGSMQGSGSETSRSYVPHFSATGACIFPLPMAWIHGNGMAPASGGETRRSYPHHLPGTSSRISSGNWVKLMAALKWMRISKRLAARRARIVDLDYPIVGSGMRDVARLEDWC